MDYKNPNDYWLHPDMSDLTEEEHYEVCSKMLLYGCGTYALAAIVFLVLVLLFGCTTTKYVPVKETHDVHHYHTDSIRQTDSIISERQTTIMQLDSAAMSQYGIQMKSMQTAWLIQTDRLQRVISELRSSKSDTAFIHDSIAYPVEVIKEVPRQRSSTETGLLIVGILAIIFAALYAVIRIKHYLPGI